LIVKIRRLIILIVSILSRIALLLCTIGALLGSLYLGFFYIEIILLAMCAFYIALIPSKYLRSNKLISRFSVMLWLVLFLSACAIAYADIVSYGLTIYVLTDPAIFISILILLLATYLISPGNRSTFRSPVHLILLVPIIASTWLYGLPKTQRDVHLWNLESTLKNWSSPCTHALCSAAPVYNLQIVPEAESIEYYAKNHPERVLILDSTDILLLFRSQDFSALDAYFERLNAGFNAGDIPEAVYLDAFSTDIFYEFSVDDAQHLQQWVETSPDSYLAHGLLGLYHDHLGWKHRGSSFSSKTTATQFELLHENMELSHVDLSRALSLNPRFMIAHMLRIAQVKMLPEEQDTSSISLLGNALKRQAIAITKLESTRHYVDEALEIFPNSFAIRSEYLGSLLPRWGGSHELMRQFALESQALVSLNPRLRALLSYELADKADILANEGRPSEAIQSYQEANYHGVIAANRIMEARVQADMYEWYAKLEIQSNLIENYPNKYPEAWLDLGYENYRLDQFDEAEFYYLGALQADASYYWITSIIYYLDSMNPSMTAQLLQSELNKNPKNVHLQLAHAYVLMLHRDKEAVDAYSAFLESCNREYCNSGALDIARKFEACIAGNLDCVLEPEIYEYAL